MWGMFGGIRGNTGGTGLRVCRGFSGDSVGDSLGIHWGIHGGICGVRGKSETLSDKFSFHLISLHFISFLVCLCTAFASPFMDLALLELPIDYSSQALVEKTQLAVVAAATLLALLAAYTLANTLLVPPLWRHLFFCSQWPLSLRTPRTQNSSTKRVS